MKTIRSIFIIFRVRAVDYQSTRAVDYPSTRAIDYPSTLAVDYPSKHAVDYPSKHADKEAAVAADALVIYKFELAFPRQMVVRSSGSSVRQSVCQSLCLSVRPSVIL